MSLAYYPFYPERYEADTAHLTTLEDGAYNRLLRLCWRSPGCKLPHDLPWISRQMRAHSPEDRAAIRAVIDEFFYKGPGQGLERKIAQSLCAGFGSTSEQERGRKKGCSR